MMSERPCTVVKVGGSLYDLPDLAARLRTMLAGLSRPRMILFPGGGPAAEVIRSLDLLHGLGEESAHWLALRALSVNAHFLQTLVPEFPVAIWPDIGEKVILEPFAFARADDNTSDHLPHSWEVTSDSLAARAAYVLGAHELILLKSISLPEGMTWPAAAQAGIVDRFFPQALEQAKSLRVVVLNCRTLISFPF